MDTTAPQPPTLGSLTVVGVVAGVLGGVVAFILWLIAGLFGMPTQVEIPEQGLQDLAWFQFIGFATMSGALGGIVAGLLRNVGNGPRIFSIVAIVVLVVSMVGPLAQPDTVAWSTKIVLMATHVVVYLAVVPAVTRRMSTLA